MYRFKYLLGVSALALIFSAGAAADTLELKDGRVLQGKFLGGTQVVVRFEVDGDVQTFRVTEIVGVTFNRNSRRSQDDVAPSDAPPNAPSDQSRPSDPPPPSESPAQRQQSVYAAPGSTVTIPAGQDILVRMIDEVDSKHNQVGDVFHASLETDLTVNDVLVARRGSDIYGRLAYAREAGHLAGSAELQLELTRIVIDGREFPIVSGDYTLRGKGRGEDTAKKVGGGAVA